MFQIVNK